MSSDNLHSDKELFALIAAGNKEAFTNLFHSYTEKLLPFINKLTGPAGDAEEIIQEVFLKLWMHREKLNTIDNPKAYIVSIVSNESTNYLQKLARQNRLTEKAKSLKVESPLSPAENIALKETGKLINEAIQHLTPACREVYILSREEHLSIPEIATRLQRSENTVKNQLVRALKEIREYIRKNGHHFLTLGFIFLIFFGYG